MIADWPDREAFEAWWRQNVIAFNRLSVTDPREWERIAQAIEKFNTGTGTCPPVCRPIRTQTQVKNEQETHD